MTIIIYQKKLRPSGIALFPFILIHVYSKGDQFLLNHEKIHIRQQIELLVIPFYLFYMFNYIYNLLKYRDHNKAYRNIIFEREAFRNEKNLNYLKGRKLWAFTRFVK
jgi:hypothetical protein